MVGAYPSLARSYPPAVSAVVDAAEDASPVEAVEAATRKLDLPRMVRSLGYVVKRRSAQTRFPISLW